MLWLTFPGCTGLEELLGIEPAFLEFQDTLFSRASMTLERSVQSKEVNEKLDVGISLFLTRLCPYFLLKPAHKCIEWLVHRYVCQINLYRVRIMMTCLPVEKKLKLCLSVELQSKAGLTFNSCRCLAASTSSCITPTACWPALCRTTTPSCSSESCSSSGSKTPPVAGIGCSACRSDPERRSLYCCCRSLCSHLCRFSRNQACRCPEEL